MRACMTFFVLLTYSAVVDDASGQPQHSISGRVLDPADNPIQGVRVQAYRSNRSVGRPSTSDKDGKYSIEFTADGTIDTVRYDHSDYYLGAVDDISGRNNHSVYKTLYKRGQKLTYFQAQEVLSAFERIHEIDRSNKQVGENLDLYKYRAALEEIERLIAALDAPPELRRELMQKVAAIKQKYGIQ